MLIMSKMRPLENIFTVVLMVAGALIVFIWLKTLEMLMFFYTNERLAALLSKQLEIPFSIL